MRFTGEVLILALMVVLFSLIYKTLQPKKPSDYQLEKMQVAKHNCEFENPDKQCVLIWDYAPVSKE